MHSEVKKWEHLTYMRSEAALKSKGTELRQSYITESRHYWIHGVLDRVNRKSYPKMEGFLYIQGT